MIPGQSAEDESSLLADRCAYVAGRCAVGAFAATLDDNILATVVLTEVIAWYYANERAFGCPGYATVTMQARKSHLRTALSSVALICFALVRRPLLILPAFALGVLPRPMLAALGGFALPRLLAGFTGVEVLIQIFMLAAWAYGAFLPTQCFTLAIFVLYLLEGALILML